MGFPFGPKGIPLSQLPLKLQKRFLYNPDEELPQTITHNARHEAQQIKEDVLSSRSSGREIDRETRSKTNDQKRTARQIDREIGVVVAHLKTLKKRLKKAEAELNSRSKAYDRYLDRESKAASGSNRSNSDRITNKERNARERTRKAARQKQIAFQEIRTIKGDIKQKRKQLEKLQDEKALFR